MVSFEPKYLSPKQSTRRGGSNEPYSTTNATMIDPHFDCHHCWAIGGLDPDPRPEHKNYVTNLDCLPRPQIAQL